MSKIRRLKQIMAIIGLVLIVVLYVWAFVSAIMARPEANATFMAAIICTAVVPILLYVMTWLARVFSGRDLIETMEKQEQLRQMSENQAENKKSNSNKNNSNINSK